LKVDLKVDPTAFLEKNMAELLKKKTVYSLFTVLWISDLLKKKEGVRRQEAIEALKGLQTPDGSVKGTPDNTAFFIMALRKAGVPCEDETVWRAAKFLIKGQGVDGGWGPPDKSVTFITAWTLGSLYHAKQLPENVLGKAVKFLERPRTRMGAGPTSMWAEGGRAATA